MKRRSIRTDNGWRIGEERPPSPRGYLKVVRKIVDSKNKQVRSIYEEAKRDFLAARNLSPDSELSPMDSQSFKMMLFDRLQRSSVFLPQAPRQEILEIIGTPVTKRTVQKTKRDLRRAGAPDRVLLRLIPADQPDRNINAIDLFDAGVGRSELQFWAKEGISLIKKTTIEKQWFEDALVDAVRDGIRWETLARRLSQALDPLRGRYELIARDQIAKLNGKITQSLQTKAGCTEFIWRTTGDERVRSSHRAVNGKKFSWYEGAPNTGFYRTNGLPGQAGQCRCIAQPVAPDWWKNL